MNLERENSDVEKILDFFPRIDKFLWYIELKLGVRITAIVLIVFVLLIVSVATGAYEDSHPGISICSILFLVINVIVLILVIVGIQKKMLNLLKPALLWGVFSLVIIFVFIIYYLVKVYLITFVVNVFIFVVWGYFWIVLLSLYESMTTSIKVTPPEVKLEAA